MKKNLFFQKVGKTSVIPISFKILGVFLCLLLFSNFITNYINMLLNRKYQFSVTNQLLVKELKEIYTNASNQYEIFKFSSDREESVSSILSSAKKGFTHAHSMLLGVSQEGSIVFGVGADGYEYSAFPDEEALENIVEDKENGITEGSVYFTTDYGRNIAVYKYHDDWQCFLIRSELLSDMNADSNHVFMIICIITVVLILVFLVLGFYMFNQILRYLKQMIQSLYEMQQKQELALLDLSGAPNDDITYLGASFNSLSSSINNLMSIFRRFTTRDVVEHAYKDHHVGLEGAQRELTILFSDIKGFTYMTETLGNDIINLLNIHYSRTINKVHDQNGIIGSIIGDAVLAIYGALQGDDHNKSLEALRSAWAITKETKLLRDAMIARRVEIEKERSLTEAEERVYKAVLIDVGVGIDGGTVFYGNIGSMERMTTTVIGDNVNAASRLEGLTRIYHLPVIVSEFVKNDISQFTSQYRFYEIDTVQVKGKTEGKKIYFPYDTLEPDEKLEKQFESFEAGLKEYYAGNWTEARKLMRQSELESAEIFLERMSSRNVPENWSGIWTMTTK
ncbi:MAG: adenylate/guanylate cyclase domain-containing protein [Spirochaetaceae bacterium]|nr:adenylate/guanylate cyclase domain-containing protein [Spirochaetaceae bacterium]